MNSRAVVTQGALAVAGLAAAYVTWQRQPDLQAGETFALDLSHGDLEKVRFEDTEFKSWTELLRDKDANGSFVTVHMSGSDASGIPMPSGHPSIPIKVPERLVRGNEGADRLFDKFAPLRATRGLGTLDAAKLKDLGLETTKKRIEVVARGTQRRFAIAPAPPGGSDPYIRDEQDGRVYIVPHSILTDFQAAQTNLVERRFHSFRLEDTDRVVVTAGAKKKEFRAVRIDELPGVRLVPAGSDKPDETAKNWHDRIWNMFPAEVLGKGEAPKEGTPKVQVRVDYFARGRNIGWVELGRSAPPPANESTTQPAAPETPFARSEFTLGWMRLPNEIGNLIADGEKLTTH